MISVLFLSLLSVSHAERDDNHPNACTAEWNPVRCPDPNKPGPGGILPNLDDVVKNCKTYGNVCEFGYADPKEDPFLCGYGTCPECACPMIYDPVCCDGEDYDSQCVVDCDGFDGICKKGACVDHICKCTAEWNPVCCEDWPFNGANTEFGNPCGASCAELTDPELIACEYGTCDKPDSKCGCELIHDPVCCHSVNNDGQNRDFANRCVAECEIPGLPFDDFCSAGACKECACSREYNPVCCPSKDRNKLGTTYGNTCLADCAKTDAEMLDCFYGECASCPCPFIHSPVCCDGVEYGNQCEADCDEASNCRDLPCDLPRITGSSVSADVDALMTLRLEEEIEEIEGEIAEFKEAEEGGTSAQFENKSRKDCICTMEYAPLCCSGETYDNRCMAECDGFFNPTSQCDVGACDELCKCTKEINLVCCPGNEQFGNPCTAACGRSDAELIRCEYGACPSACACPLLHAPVCCGGVEYGNDCMAECSGIDAGTCRTGECPTPCTMEYDPQCCDGLQYDNPCVADANGASNCKSGECEVPCRCTREYVPVCCGETTYGNVCNAECADEDLVACDYGECDDDSSDCEDECGNKVKPICCNGEEYENKCLAKCDGRHPKRCNEGKCKYSAAAAPLFSAPISDPMGSAYEYGFVDVNTVLLVLIFVAVASFVVVYSYRTAPRKMEKMFVDSVESLQ